MTTPTSSGAPASPLTPGALPRGKFIWYELQARDPEAAIAFYAQVIGWGTQRWDGLSEPYVMFTTGETPTAGMMKLTPEMGEIPPHWLGYVCVPDVDASEREAESLGGKVLLPAMDVPTVGRVGVIADPQGAAIGLFTPLSAQAEQAGMPGVGQVSWHELTTTDHAAAFEFYRKLFGWEHTSDFDMGPMGTYFMFGRNGVTLGGMFDKPAEMPVPPHWLYYVHVDSAEAAAERVTAAGGRVLNGPMEVPGGDRIAQLMDPQGAAFAVHSPKAAG